MAFLILSLRLQAIESNLSEQILNPTVYYKSAQMTQQPFLAGQIQIESDTFNELFLALFRQAQSLPFKEAEDRRLMCKVNTLAKSLYIDNKKVNQFENQLINRTYLPQPISKDLLMKDFALMWEISNSINPSTANTHTLQFQQLLLDILKSIDPESYKNQKIGIVQEPAEWEKWIGAIQAFMPPAKTIKEPIQPIQFKTSKDSIQTILFVMDANHSHKLRALPATITVELIQNQEKPTDHTESIQLELDAFETSQLPLNFEEEFNQLIAPLPKLPYKTRAKVSIDCAQKTAMHLNQQQLLACVSVITKSILSNQVLRPAFLLGIFNEKQQLLIGKNSWLRLQALPDKKNQLLIVSHELRTQLASFILFKQKEFFTRNEVISVAEMSEIIEILKNDPSNIAVKASIFFNDLLLQQKNASLDFYLDQSQVKKSLQQIQTNFPSHASAYFLNIYNQRNFPITLDRQIVATLIDQAIFSATPDQLHEDPEAIIDHAKSTLALLQPLTQKEDDDLINILNEFIERVSFFKKNQNRKPGDIFSAITDRFEHREEMKAFLENTRKALDLILSETITKN